MTYPKSNKANDFMSLLRGGSKRKTPFWEVWFYMFDFCKRRYGVYENVENRIAMACDLGMDAVPLLYMDTNALFVKSSFDSNGVQHYNGGLLESLDQLSSQEYPDFKGHINNLKEDQKKITDAGLFSCMTLMHCFHAGNISMGLENLSLKIYDDPGFVHHYFEWVESRNRRAVEEVAAEIMPDFVLFDGDCAFKSGLMVQPDLYKKLVFDKTKQTVSLLEKLGIPYVFHSDGKIDELLPILIELGFSACHGCEKIANCLCDLVENFGDDICLVGNMDVMFLAQSSPQEIRAETEKMLLEGSVKSKFIAACNTSPQDNIPDENYLAFCDTIKHFDR